MNKFLNISFLNFIDKKRITKNIFGQLSIFVNSIIIQLFFIPLMLIAWGPKNTGLWLFLTSIPSAISFWKLSFSEASRQQLILSGETNKNKLYSISLILTLLVIIIIGVIYFIINFFFFLDNFTIVQNTKTENLKYIILIIFITFSLDLLNNNHLVMSQYKGKIYITNLIQIIYLLFSRSLIVVCGFFTDKLFFASLFLLFAMILKYIFTKIILLRNKISFKFKMNLLNKKKIKYIFNTSLKYYYNDISLILNTSTFIFILGIFFDAKLVAYIIALNTLFRFFIIKFCGIITNVLSYEIPYLFKGKKINKLVKILSLQSKFIYSAVFLFLVGSYLFGDYLFNLWTVGKFTDFHNRIILLVCIEAIVFILGYNQLVFGMYLNKLNNITLWSLIFTIFTYISLIIFLSIMLFFLSVILFNFLLLFKGQILINLKNKLLGI